MSRIIQPYHTDFRGAFGGTAPRWRAGLGKALRGREAEEKRKEEAGTGHGVILFKRRRLVAQPKARAQVAGRQARALQGQTRQMRDSVAG